MDIHRIKYFLCASECSSLSEAAKQLHISQPALSHQIKLLEEELEVKLFLRSNIGLKLTDAGQALIPWAQRLLDDTNAVKDMMSSLQNVFTGDLRVACSSSSGRYILPLMVARFCKRYTGVRVKILACRPESAALNLLEGEAHLGIVSSELSATGLESQEFFRDEISLIVPRGHAWSKRASIDVSEITQEPIILREESSGTRRVMMEELSQFDISLEDLNIFMEVGNVEAVLEVVAGGYGISFVSDLASRYMRELGYVVKIPVDGLNLQRANYMARKRITTPHRARDVFWGFIHDTENKDLLHSRHVGQIASDVAGKQ
jgi:DNA-binding transcriptional LysR family regulator